MHVLINDHIWMSFSFLKSLNQLKANLAKVVSFHNCARKYRSLLNMATISKIQISLHDISSDFFFEVCLSVYSNILCLFELKYSSADQFLKLCMEYQLSSLHLTWLGLLLVAKKTFSWFWMRNLKVKLKTKWAVTCSWEHLVIFFLILLFLRAP